MRQVLAEEWDQMIGENAALRRELGALRTSFAAAVTSMTKRLEKLEEAELAREEESDDDV